MLPQRHPTQDASAAIRMTNKHLGIKPIDPQHKSTAPPTETVTASTTFSTMDDVKFEFTKLPQRYNGSGYTRPYASFCADYYYSLKFPEALKSRDQFVDIQTVEHVNLFDDGLQLREGQYKKITNVRMLDAEETKEVVHSMQKAPCASSMN